MLGAKKPKNLLISECGGLLLRNDAGGVVGAELEAARAARPCANVLGSRVELDGLEAGRVVRPDGRRAASFEVEKVDEVSARSASSTAAASCERDVDEVGRT